VQLQDARSHCELGYAHRPSMSASTSSFASNSQNSPSAATTLSDAATVLAAVHTALRIERHGPVAEIILVGPGKGNAMGPDFWREVPCVFRALHADTDTRVVLVRGAGGNFSYGLDLMAMAGELGPRISGQQQAFERTQLLAFIDELQDAFNAIAACRKPVIAAVAGWCIGGALDMIAACDVRLASADARFSLREVKVAMVADLGSLQRLPAIIGEGNTRELALTGRNIDATTALRMGLVTDVLANEEALLVAARAMAVEIAENPALVVQGIKAVMNSDIARGVADGLRTVALWNSAFLQSEDLGEAMMAFMQRRPPQFKGR
jgi:enoyl-CoA hydratase